MFAFIIFEFKVHMYNTMYNNTLNYYDPALMGLSSTLLSSLHCTIKYMLPLCVYV